MISIGETDKALDSETSLFVNNAEKRSFMDFLKVSLPNREGSYCSMSSLLLSCL